MAYAACREHPDAAMPAPRPANACASPRPGRAAAPHAAMAPSFHMLDVTVCCADALRVRRGIAACSEAGVVRCEPLLYAGGSHESDAPCVRLMIRLPLTRYAEVLHCLVECVPSGEIGRLVSWREHLARCGLRHGH